MRRTAFGSSLLILLLACTPASKSSSAPAFSVFRLDRPAVVELSPDQQPIHEFPVSIPEGCSLDNTFPSPRGAYLAMELACPFGQAVVWLDTNTGLLKQAVTDSDSHFLAWTADGTATYLKVDTINRPHIIRAQVGGGQETIPITELTYDLSPNSNGQDFMFSFSRGMGFGSEMDLAQFDGASIKQVILDRSNYLSFARWSPGGTQIAFIKIPDSPTPYTVGELWVMDTDGEHARKLAAADAGHGYAPAWSPDGTRIAFVVRENPDDAQADQAVDALRSNLYIVSTKDGKLRQLTKFQDARVQAPAWSPDGNKIASTVVLNDKMDVYLFDSNTGEARKALAEPACCAAWLQK